MTATDIIRMVLKNARGRYMAVHEITESARIQGHYISDNAAASRLCMELKGEADGRFREGKRFKEWAIPLDSAPKSEPRGKQGLSWFFYSDGRSAVPGPYFATLEALMASPGYKPGYRIWLGNHGAPVPYEGAE